MSCVGGIPSNVIDESQLGVSEKQVEKEYPFERFVQALQRLTQGEVDDLIQDMLEDPGVQDKDSAHPVDPNNEDTKQSGALDGIDDVYDYTKDEVIKFVSSIQNSTGVTTYVISDGKGNVTYSNSKPAKLNAGQTVTWIDSNGIPQSEVCLSSGVVVSKTNPSAVNVISGVDRILSGIGNGLDQAVKQSLTTMSERWADSVQRMEGNALSGALASIDATLADINKRMQGMTFTLVPRQNQNVSDVTIKLPDFWSLNGTVETRVEYVKKQNYWNPATQYVVKVEVPVVKPNTYTPNFNIPQFSYAAFNNAALGSLRF